MNVLSLFDGISCGRIALERANISITNYFASEIDKNAIKITTRNYPNTIQLGSVVDIKKDSLPKIDLLIGGSPCQGFSFVGKQLNFDDDRSKLFFEYVRLLKELKPKYFFLENVRMQKKFEDVISYNLGVSPTNMNSSLVSAQTRNRLYWTNIPFNCISNKHVMFDKWLYQIPHGYFPKRVFFARKYPCLCVRHPGCQYRVFHDNIDVAKIDVMKMDSKGIRQITKELTPEECEELQTLPMGYTNGVSKTARYHAIGNCWTVDIVSHIFLGIHTNRTTNNTLTNFIGD